MIFRKSFQWGELRKKYTNLLSTFLSLSFTPHSWAHSRENVNHTRHTPYTSCSIGNALLILALNFLIQCINLVRMHHKYVRIHILCRIQIKIPIICDQAVIDSVMYFLFSQPKISMQYTFFLLQSTHIHEIILFNSHILHRRENL